MFGFGRHGLKRKKNKRVSIRDPISSCDSNWFKNAKTTYGFKGKWEAMQALMEFATGDPLGHKPMPKQFRPNKKAGAVLALFAQWLNDDNGHIFTRKHIMRLLIPFSKSYNKSCWKTAGLMAKGLMTIQWMEKTYHFLPLVTPALIAVYEASDTKLISWISDLENAANSEQRQIRMSVWDFLSKICIVGDLNEFNISTSKTTRDIKDILHNRIMMKALERALLEDHDKATRDSAAMFVYAAKNLTGSTRGLRYKEICRNKRAEMALDIASDNYFRARRILKGQHAPTNEDIAKKQERKQAESAAKNQRKRKNNMRAAIMAAKQKTKQQGGVIQRKRKERRQRMRNLINTMKGTAAEAENAKRAERKRKHKLHHKEDIRSQQQQNEFEEQRIFYEMQNEINIDDLVYENQKLQKETKRLIEVNNALKQQVANMLDDEKNVESEDKCKVKFAEWLCNTVKMRQYLTSFEENEYDDIRMVEFLDRDTLQNDVGIKKQLHCKLILKKVNEFKLLQQEFNALLCDNKPLNQHRQQFEQHAILTLNDLRNDIKSIQELSNMINVADKNKLNQLWVLIHSDDDQNISNISSHKEKEGQMTEYH